MGLGARCAISFPIRDRGHGSADGAIWPELRALPKEIGQSRSSSMRFIVVTWTASGMMSMLFAGKRRPCSPQTYDYARLPGLSGELAEKLKRAFALRPSAKPRALRE